MDDRIYTDPEILYPAAIKIIEEDKKATYVCETCLRGTDGQWVNKPVAVFYTEEKHPEGSNYFGIYWAYTNYETNNRKLRITDAISATKEDIWGIVAADGEIVYSRYRWDYRGSKDGSVFIDGGRDYTRTGWNVGAKKPQLVKMRIIKDKLTIIE